MTTDVDAILAYGYDLGGPGRPQGWNLDDTVNGQYQFNWWDPNISDVSFSDAAYDTLQNYRRNHTDAIVGGVQVVWYGSEVKWTGLNAGYILAATHYSTYFSHTLPIHPLAMLHHDHVAWGRSLKQALAILDIRPLNPEPCWLLAASHGI